MYSIEENLRKKVIERDGNKCVNCGKETQVIHHIYPKGRGGKDDLDNLICLCDKCHGMVHQLGHITIGSWIKEFKLYTKQKNEKLNKIT